MIRYFICENCHKGYDADDVGNTNCPYCHSDNVRPARKIAEAWKYVGLVAMFVIFCIIGYLLPIDKKENTENSHKNDSLTEITVDSTVVTPIVSSPAANPVVHEKDTIMVPVIKDISTPVMNASTYSFKVAVQVPSGDKYRVCLMEEFGTEYLQVSNDGNFKNIAPIEGGVYKVVAENIKTGDKSQEKFVSGCNPIKKIDQITAGQLQAAFMTGSIPSKDFMTKFVTSPKINVVGMEADEPQVTNVGEVFNRIGSGLWLEVEVIDIDYAPDNRVNSFTVKVTY